MIRKYTFTQNQMSLKQKVSSSHGILRTSVIGHTIKILSSTKRKRKQCFSTKTNYIDIIKRNLIQLILNVVTLLLKERKQWKFLGLLSMSTLIGQAISIKSQSNVSPHCERWDYWNDFFHSRYEKNLCKRLYYQRLTMEISSLIRYLKLFNLACKKLSTLLLDLSGTDIQKKITA